jgi:hypothetical protein
VSTASDAMRHPRRSPFNLRPRAVFVRILQKRAPRYLPPADRASDRARHPAGPEDITAARRKFEYATDTECLPQKSRHRSSAATDRFRIRHRPFSPIAGTALRAPIRPLTDAIRTGPRGWIPVVPHLPSACDTQAFKAVICNDPDTALISACQAGRSNGRGYSRSRGFVVPRSLRRFCEGHHPAHRSFRATWDSSPAPNDRDAQQRCCRSAAGQCAIATLCPVIALDAGPALCALRRCGNPASPLQRRRHRRAVQPAEAWAFRGMTTSRR